MTSYLTIATFPPIIAIATFSLFVHNYDFITHNVTFSYIKLALVITCCIFYNISFRFPYMFVNHDSCIKSRMLFLLSLTFPSVHTHLLQHVLGQIFLFVHSQNSSLYFLIGKFQSETQAQDIQIEQTGTNKVIWNEFTNEIRVIDPHQQKTQWTVINHTEKRKLLGNSSACINFPLAYSINKLVYVI